MIQFKSKISIPVELRSTFLNYFSPALAPEN